VASNDLGDLGPKESSPVTYKWSLVDNIIGLAVWVVLVLAFVLFRANRSGKALLILIPVLVVNVLWIGVKKVTGMPSSSAGQFDVMFNAFTIGLATVWLLSHRFAGLNRFVVFLLTVVAMSLTYALSILSYSGLEFTEETMMLAVFFFAVMVAALLAFALTGWRCRKNYSPLRFMLWLALWCPVLCLLAMFAYVLAIVVIMHQSISTGQLFTQIPIVGLLIGGVLYLLLLPYMILVLNSDLFRSRFYGCFRLKGMPAPAVVVESQDQPDAWNIS